MGALARKPRGDGYARELMREIARLADQAKQDPPIATVAALLDDALQDPFTRQVVLREVACNLLEAFSGLSPNPRLKP
jgi:hypothetical protein